MFELNANGSVLTKSIAVQMMVEVHRSHAMDDWKWLAARGLMDQAKYAGIVNIAMLRALVSEDFEAFTPPAFTICGIPVEVSDEVPEDQLQLRAHGRLLGTVFGIGKPNQQQAEIFGEGPIPSAQSSEGAD